MVLTITTFIGFTLLVLGISYHKSRKLSNKSDEGYFLAGRGLTGWVIAASLMLTNLSTEQMVGLNGQGFAFNMSVMGWEVGASLALIIVALYFLPRYLRKGYTTIPEFVGERYDDTTKLLVNGLFLLGYVFILCPIVLYSGAVGMGGIFDLMGTFNISYMTTIWIVVFAIGLLGCVYTVCGGLRIMAWADTVNGIGLLFGGLMIPILGLFAIGDGNIIAGITTLVTEHPEKFNAIGKTTDPVPFATMFTGMFLVNLFYWGTNQVIIQRALAAKNLKEGQKGLLLAAIFKLFGPLFLIIPGIIAFHMFGTLANQDLAYPEVVKAILPTYFLGFFAAVLFGAILSSFNAALNSTSTLFMMNIYKPYINPQATEKSMVSKGKIVAVILAVFSMLVAPMIAKAPQGLFTYLQTANGLYNVPIFTLIMVGMFNKKAPAWAAKAALVFFIIAYGLTQTVFASKMAEMHMHFLHILAILFVICGSFMILMGHLYPAKHKYEADVDRKIVDTKPWSKAYIVSGIIALAVVGLYVLFSPLGIAK
ncbi:SSS family solute:Na+ symporter [Elusimicrobium simillimum]|uniref:solute:sodium symporter family transporter n=1 Tax=Elusimicrobium simillimum TaxID=3143438 RepID=UPI003C6F26F3